MYKTPTFKAVSKDDQKWYIIDLKDKVLGRAATEIANLLRGKNKPGFSPNVICGDYVVVINAQQIKLTGNKLNAKEYVTHSGFPGGIKKTPAVKMLAEKPEELIKQAVFGMLPKNRLRKKMMLKLKIFSGAEHSHEAQQPVSIEL